MRTHEYIIACVSLFYYRASLAFINGHRKSRGNRCRVEEASTVKDSCGNFNWNNQWYPVGVIDQLDKERPHPIIVRGRELVLWFDESMTEWRVFEDRCPHRAAPLSEGRVEASGHLFCAYHAWTFDGQGQCSNIPQASSDDAMLRLMANKRSCAKNFATMESIGLVWVWGMSMSDDHELLSAQSQNLPVIPEEFLNGTLCSSGTLWQSHWDSRVLPYGWESLMENLIDPAHVAVAHHGVYGDRYKDPRPFRNHVTRDEGHMGFSVAQDPPPHPVESNLGFGPIRLDVIRGSVLLWPTRQMKGHRSTVHHFYPPGLMRLDIEEFDGRRIILVVYGTPTTMGSTRYFATVLLKSSADSESALPRSLLEFNLPVPRWVYHTAAPIFLHQDMVFLHRQEKLLHARRDLLLNDDCGRGESWNDMFFSATSADIAPNLLRTWVDKYGNGMMLEPAHIPKAAIHRYAQRMPPVEENEERLYDTYHAHTKNCVHCSKALRNIKVLSFATNSLALILGAATVETAVEGLTAPVLGNVAGDFIEIQCAEAAAALLLGSIGVALRQLEGMMHMYYFKHQEN